MLLVRYTIALLLLFLTACAGQDPYILTPVSWPQSPAKPEITLVAAGSTADDFGVKKSMFGRFWDWIAGENDELILRRPIDVAWRGHAIIVIDEGGMLWSIEPEHNRFEQLADLYSDGIYPAGIAVDGTDIWVSDAAGDRLVCFSQDGDLLTEIKLPGRPLGLDAKHGRIAVALPAKQAIWVGNKSSGKLYGKRGTGVGQFNYPTDVAFAQDGALLIVDSLNFRIQHWFPGSATATFYGSYGDDPAHFIRPRGVAVDGAGNLYISDMLYDNVQIFRPSGRVLVVGATKGVGRLWAPAGLDISAGQLVVADSYNGRIVIYRVRR